METMNAILVWCFVWSVGANISDSSRGKFNEYCKKEFVSLISARFTLLLSDFYGCYIDFSTPLKTVKTWENIMPTFMYDKNEPFFSILVPTIDTTRYRYLLDKLMNANHNVLFMAETGVGKSVVISSFLNDMVSNGKTVSYVMGYSAQTKVCWVYLFVFRFCCFIVCFVVFFCLIISFFLVCVFYFYSFFYL